MTAPTKLASTERPHWRTIRPGFWVGLLSFTLAITPFRVVEVSGRSMYPTLNNGERYLMDRFYYRASGLHRDDVLVLTKDGDELVKRLVGMPGDKLEMVMGPEAIIFELVNRTTGQQSRWPYQNRGNLFRRKVTVPPDHIYVLGDNWWASDDSRSFGPVPMSSIHGVLRTFTFKRSFPRKREQGR